LDFCNSLTLLTKNALYRLALAIVSTNSLRVALLTSMSAGGLGSLLGRLMLID
jgi:hypothetical protein